MRKLPAFVGDALMKRLLFLLITAALAALVGCGKPTPPLPPSLQLPAPPTDLAAARKGDRVRLVWTQPVHNTDQTTVRKPIVERICRAVNQFPLTGCPLAIGQLPPAVPKEKQSIEYTEILPANLMEANPTGMATYAVQPVNQRGRSPGISNQVRVPLAVTLPPPGGMKAQVTADGILISFPRFQSHDTANLKFSVRVLRHTEGPAVPPAGKNAPPPPPPDVVVADVLMTANQPPQIVDSNFEWEKTYSYRATTVTNVYKEGEKLAEIEGDDSSPIEVFAHDVFPPAVPVEVEAVASGVGQQPFIDVTWAPDSDPDLDGYYVYRRQGKGPEIKLNVEPVTTPSYRDSDLQRGRTYTYAVSAIDVRGNESAKSQPSSETIP
jgi:hypothetical protein